MSIKYFLAITIVCFFCLAASKASGFGQTPDTLVSINDRPLELSNSIPDAYDGNLEVVSLASGTITTQGDASSGNYIYTPDGGFEGIIPLVFHVSNQKGEVQGPFTLMLKIRDPSFDERIDLFFSKYISKPLMGVVFYSFQVGNGQNLVEVPYILVWLIIGALFCTVFFKFVNLRHFKTSIDIVRGKYTDPNEKGEVSHFQALTAALSGTVGLGNIGGVAVAVSMGGPGATFWMILAGFFGMSSKFAECTLGVKYREISPEGKVFGGPMYYLQKGLKEQFNTSLGKVLAVLFAIFCIGASFGGGNMYQSNQAYKQIASIPWFSGVPGWAFGLVVAVVVGVVIIGGIKSIARVTDKLVPGMVAIYLIAAFIILGYHFSEIPTAFATIIRSAFDGGAIKGGIIGVIIQGVRRSAFSNEAGFGSAPIAHAAVKTNHAASEGLVALLEPFIDTIVVCTMTALVIVVTGQYQDTTGIEGVKLTSKSFESVLPWFPYVLTGAVMLFAVSTMVSWSYYGTQAWAYLFGKSKTMDVIYKVLFCSFIVVGASTGLGAVIEFSDAMLFMMAVPNFIGIYLLAPVIKRELSAYLGKIKSGEIKTVK